MKKLLVALFTVLCFVPLTVFGKENERVKVYIFEAGGCPYCEMQVEYLEGLDSYNKTFEIVRKEAFVDHVDWKPGADYELGNNVAAAFTAAGKPTQMEGTPFVVISDLYAEAAYSDNLESIINQAYEEGDKDVVQCVADGKDNCVRQEGGESDASALMVIVLLVFLVTYIVKSELDKKRILSAIYAKKLDK